MHIILVQLYSELQPPNAEPLAVEALAGAIHHYCEGVVTNIQVVNLLLDVAAISRLVALISESQCRLLGISVPQGTYSVVRQLLDTIQSALDPTTRPLVVLGHALPTHNPSLFLQDYPWTIVVRGWGENALVELTKRLLVNDEVSLSDIPSISYIRDGEMHSNSLALTTMPQVPKRFEPNRFFARVETSRGCHYGLCTFCTRPPGKKDYWSRIPIATIRSSIQELKEQGIKYFTFTDEDFIGNDLEGARAIAALVSDLGSITFSMSVRADNIVNPKGSNEENEQRLAVMRDLRKAGLSFVYIGVESLSNSQLKRYGKGLRVSDSLAAVNIVKSLEIPLEVGFILFDPFVTIDELKENAENLRSADIWANVGSLFSKLLVQKDTAYEQWLQSKHLCKGFDNNLMSYDWEFQDQKVADIAQLCLTWSDAYHSVYRLLRNLERTKQDHSMAKTYMLRMRSLDLYVLDSLLHVVHQKLDQIFIPQYYFEQRVKFSQELYSSLSGKAESDEEKLLLTELRQFLAVH